MNIVIEMPYEPILFEEEEEEEERFTRMKRLNLLQCLTSYKLYFCY